MVVPELAQPDSKEFSERTEAMENLDSGERKTSWDERQARPSTCRVCGQALHSFLDLGSHPRSEAYRDPTDRSPELMFDLKVGICESCHLVQLEDEVPPEMMFNSSYPFRTSSSQRMQRHFQETALALLEKPVHEKVEPLVVELGCNDGTFLATFAELGIDHVGIDPAENLVAEAVDRGVNAETGWFNADTAAKIFEKNGYATVIYAANTICHISDLQSVFKGIDHLLARDGILVFEDPYLGDIVRLGAFDQIYDEHIFYFSATSVSVLAKSFGLKLMDIEHLPTHGGQIRYTIGRDHQEESDRVLSLIQSERDLGLHTRELLTEFSRTVELRKAKLVQALENLATTGKTIAGYAATAKSGTVLNYCGITSKHLSVIYDTTPEKQGLLTPGSGIPIEAFPEDLDDFPDNFLLFAWNHSAEIFAKESEFVRRGGSWLQYIPEVSVSEQI